MSDLSLPPDGSNGALASRRRVANLAFWSAQIVLIVGVLFVYLHGWQRDLSVPLQFARDSLSAATVGKGTLDHGWWWFNPDVGAPFGVDLRQYPASPNVDQALLWLIGLFARDPIVAMNLAWYAMVLLSGLIATACLRVLGVSRPSAFVAGLLFAFTPYAWYRNVGHLWLVTYLVPCAATAALILAAGRTERWYWGRPLFGVLFGCLLLGFNYIYYAFFACYLLVIGGLIGRVQHQSRKAIGAASLSIALVCGATAINLIPSLVSWQQLGRPMIVEDKRPAEAEIYGLKIRHLVSPGLWHRFPPFRAWLDKEEHAAFLLENENRSTRLGVVGTVGFVVLLGVLLVPRLGGESPRRRLVLGAGCLSLAAVLLATTGGFGSLFNLFVTPEIRAYNRIHPFIVFFALAAVALLLDALVRSPSRRVVAAAAVGILGLMDQSAAATDLNGRHPTIRAEFSSLRALVRSLESAYPAGSMVFQLPIRPYPVDHGILSMEPYEHLKPYLVSRSLRWSYPALSNEQVRWQQVMARLTPEELVRELAAAGFVAVLIDGSGYADGGAAVADAIMAAAGVNGTLAETTRYRAIDLGSVEHAGTAGPLVTMAMSAAPASAGMPQCAGTTTFVVDRVGGTALTSADVRPRVRGEVQVAGWAVDQRNRTVARAVDLVVDTVRTQAIYGLERNDVAGHYGVPAYQYSGFIGTFSTSGLSEGGHSLSLRIVSAADDCYYQTPLINIIVD